MNPVAKVGVVAAGYIAAILLASGVVAVRIAATSGPEAQASSGMHAFGDALVFVAVFGVAGLLPTGAALYFLRPYRRFWAALAGMALFVALVGIAAVVLFSVARDSAAPSALALWSSLSVLVILVSPLLALTFVACGFFSPYRFARIAFLGAAVVEAAVGAYGGYVWFIPH